MNESQSVHKTKHDSQQSKDAWTTFSLMHFDNRPVDLRLIGMMRNGLWPRFRPSIHKSVERPEQADNEKRQTMPDLDALKLALLRTSRAPGAIPTALSAQKQLDKKSNATGVRETCLGNFHPILYVKYKPKPEHHVYFIANPVKEPPKKTSTREFLENFHRFCLGGIGGMIGASAVYPIDVVKTRIQSQKVLPDGTKLYRSTFSAFGTIVRAEGVIGLYRGLPPLLLGVTPEKATKLAVNDFVRSLAIDSKGHIPVPAEMLAGGSAGFCQVVFTCPLEIVKIQMQMAGQTGERLKAFEVVRSLGLRQLYRGTTACWMRDIPFSAIYFPAYAHLKEALSDEKTGYISPPAMFGAACLAGVPASTLVTPSDVIKTRMQERGQTQYTGFVQAARKIMAEEGFHALWKGAFARCCRSAPQFGVTILMYEVLQSWFPLPAA